MDPLGFLKAEKGRLGKIGLGGLLVGGNAGILYIAAELATAYAGAKLVGAVTVGLATVAAAIMDFKKKQVDTIEIEEDYDEQY